MTVVTMQKVAILAHRPLRDPIIELLQKEEVLEISESNPFLPIDHTQLNFKEADLLFAIATLKEYASKETLLAMDKRPTVENVLFDSTHTDVRGIVESLRSLETKDGESEKLMHDGLSLLASLAPWTDLQYRLNVDLESEYARILFGTVASTNIHNLKNDLHTNCFRTDISEHHHGKNGLTYISVCVWKNDIRLFEDLATAHGWTETILPQYNGLPSALLEEARAKCLESKQIKERIIKERSQLSVQIPNLKNVRIYLNWLDAKEHARESMGETQETVTLFGWIPKINIANLERLLYQLSPATAIVKVKPDPLEEPPVLLRNLPFVTPFESVTKLYGLPLYREYDPTWALSPFFALFFALCLTDAGYGLVLASLFGGILFKTKKGVNAVPLLWTLFLGGMLTIVAGILFGGWFGLSPEQVSPIFTKKGADGVLLFRGQLWNLGHQNGIEFLQNLSLALGMTHLGFGMFLAGFHKWIHGKKKEALWMDFTNHLLIAGGMFYFFVANNFSLTLLVIALILFIWGKGYGSPWYIKPIIGLIGLINFSIGILSNTLSYLRILALGLVTGALAMAVNMVAVEIGNLFPKALAIPIIIGIFITGHTVSIALNTLGSFIHAGRLQFIEFFSQFFEGGGRAFAPFKRSFI